MTAWVALVPARSPENVLAIRVRAELEPRRYLSVFIEWRRFVGVHREGRCRSHAPLWRRREQVAAELVLAIPLLLDRRGMAKTILEVGELRGELGEECAHGDRIDSGDDNGHAAEDR